MTDCLINLVQKIGEPIVTHCVWPFLKPHVDYWWRFDDNIEDLRKGIAELKSKQKIEGGSEDAKKWLEESTKKLEEAQKILPDDNIPKAWNLISRYSMGKKAKTTAEEIAKHQENGKLYTTAGPAPPAMDPSTPAMRFVFDEWTMEFESRKSIEKDIIDSLKDGRFGVIGLCGMPGVGKTIMAKRIGKRVQDEKLFEEVVMVTVSQKIDLIKIQNEIAESLCLKFDVNGTTARKDKLRTRLMDKKKKIIILDDVWEDVWESLKLEDLGIPIESNFERCKVLLTSRFMDICNGIRNKMVFPLTTLENEEAWKLFKEKAGTWVENSVLRDLARDVAAECECLPIALVTVGSTLENKESHDTWSYALLQLKRSDPTDLPKTIAKKVYSSVKLSYDKLEHYFEKMLFLLCCLFPEDFNIPVQELVFYSMCLSKFNDISIEEATIKTHAFVGRFKSRSSLDISIEEATMRTHTFVESLKRRSLLTDGKDKLHVKMHDVIRDVAIHIGSKELNGHLKSFTSKKNPCDDNCNWMSVDISDGGMEVSADGGMEGMEVSADGGMEVSASSRFPNLRLLMLLNSSSSEVSDISFEGMIALNVLSFQRTWIGSLPSTLTSLKNLQTLCLVNCEAGNISVIGKLKSLEIFSCYACEHITELPTEIGGLRGLRLLELNECPKLQKIPYGIISSLTRLEELKIRRSFSAWETVGENGNAAVTELGSLSKLTCLEIEISDWNRAAQDVDLSSKLVKYWIRIGSDHNRFEQGDYRKVMILNLGGAVIDWIRLRARDTESLTLRGDGSHNVNLAKTVNLRNLEFGECSTVKKLVETKDGIVFLWETLELWSLPELEEVFNQNQNVSLCKLKSIRITSCTKLRSLFSVSAARISFLQLEVLEIENCVAMEQVFCNEIKDHTNGCIEFPELKKLRLVDLPNLTAFCQGIENIVNFPNLTEMEIRDLPNLKHSVFPLNSETLCKLKSIKIESCSILGPLFSVSVATRSCLIKLEVLEIANCNELQLVFWDEIRDNPEQVFGDEIRDKPDAFIEIPNLKKLTLVNLQNLTAFCQRENIIKFPNLTEIDIAYLPKLLPSGFRNTS